MLKSSIFDSVQGTIRQTKAGSVLQFLQSSTAMLEELECHMTTVSPGLPAHSPHEHHDEELVIVKEGEITVLLNGAENRVAAGSVVFMASGEHHGIRNGGHIPARYYVIRWRPKSG